MANNHRNITRLVVLMEETSVIVKLGNYCRVKKLREHRF